MDIKIFHGDNIAESRKALSIEIAKAKSEGKEIVVLDGKKTNLTKIRQALESSSLFGQNKLVIIENLLSLCSLPSKNKTLDYLKKEKFEASLILWEGKRLKRIPLKFPAKLFRLEPILFRFLENLKEKKTHQNIKELTELKKKEKPEVVFHMMIRQIKLLIIAKDLGKKGLGNMPSWQKEKLTSQAKFFTLEHLLEIYKKLLEIDFKQKTSRDVFSLSSRLDLLVSEI